ncbi:MAG: tetratricopeptide repeat protein, partial [Acidimicrobiales bacterium]
GAEVIEVIASHLYDAYGASSNDKDANELRKQAEDAYLKAAERAESIGAPDAAEACYLRAAELGTDEARRAGANLKAGQMAYLTGEHERALSHFEEALSAHRLAQRDVEAARATALFGRTLVSLGRIEEAITVLREALASLDFDKAPPLVVAELQVTLADGLYFSGRGDEAPEPLDQALRLSQHYELAEPLAQGLLLKGILLAGQGRLEEARLDYEGCLSVARRHGLTRDEMRAEHNLADLCMIYDLPGAEEHCRAGLELARKRGARGQEYGVAANLMYVLVMAGRLEEAYRLGTELLQTGAHGLSGAMLHGRLAHIDVLRGESEAARSHLSSTEALATSEIAEDRAVYANVESAVALSEGDFGRALGAALRAIDGALKDGLPLSHEAVRLGFPDAIDAALSSGNLDEAERLEELFSSRPPGEIPPFLRAQLRRARALLAAVRGNDEEVEEGLLAAEAVFEDLGYPYWTARAELDLAKWLVARDSASEAARYAGKAAAAFEVLGAGPMLARARALPEPGVVTSLGGVEPLTTS